ncbi:MAG: hypothetical protein II142_07270, partial [Bacteroidales bacterium]|nr:hypothetical protein [Bacteroidales bacterium]
QIKTERTDSLVRLMSAQKMELVERNGSNYRKVTGPARFLHNNTYLICDTAYWHVDRQEIEAIGNVRILQEQTVLSGDNLTYFIDRDLAEFRGTLVQLEDKDHNMLRTRFLDYNTRDSVAVFQNGGSMKDKDGQIIESQTGTYDAKVKLFTFTDQVNMFTDSIFVKTSRLTYDTDHSFATFGVATDAWKEDDMLSSDAGWYDRARELFFFRNRVHGMTQDQEVWTDSLFFWRNTRDVEMSGASQLTDTTRSVFALAGHMFYEDSLARMTLTRDPAVIGLTGEKEAQKDTVWFGSDKMVYQTFPMCDIAEGTVAASQKRLEDLSSDAVMTYRKKAAEEAEKARQEALNNDPNNPNNPNGPGRNGAPAAAADRNAAAKPPVEEPPVDTPSKASADTTVLPPTDTTALALSDTLMNMPVDTTSLSLADTTALPPMDTTALALADTTVLAPLDSTKKAFLTATGHVKLFRRDVQIACDSLEYSDLDSLVRLYKDPIVWNEGNRQYAADSLYAVIKNRAMEKASLMSNAFIIIEEEPDRCYDQIRSTEMLAYFDSTGALRRFDALGEANAVFYLKEDSTFATVNKSQAKMLYAQFKDGEIDRVYYFDTAKNDAYPLAQLKNEDRTLKGFNWQPDLRPNGPQDITELTLRPSERKTYAARPRATFKETDRYYPGYMSGVYKKIRENEEAKARRERERAERERFVQDSLDYVRKLAADSLALRDSLNVSLPDTVKTLSDSLSAVVTDSLAVGADSLKVAADSVAAPVVQLDPKAQKKAEREAAKAAREAARAARIEAREKRWAQLDSLDAAKAKLKADKKAEKERQKKLKALRAAEKQARKDQAKLEKYLRKYEKKKAKEDARKAAKEGLPAKAPDVPDQPKLPDPSATDPSTVNPSVTDPTDASVFEAITPPTEENVTEKEETP